MFQDIITDSVNDIALNINGYAIKLNATKEYLIIQEDTNKIVVIKTATGEIIRIDTSQISDVLFNAIQLISIPDLDHFVLIIGTKQGEIILLKDGEYSQPVKLSQPAEILHISVSKKTNLLALLNLQCFCWR